jgi:hypothetical protein
MCRKNRPICFYDDINNFIVIVDNDESSMDDATDKNNNNTVIIGYICRNCDILTVEKKINYHREYSKQYQKTERCKELRRLNKQIKKLFI